MKTVKEGLVKILVPKESLTKRSETFYNPGMRYQRDVTISFLKAHSKVKELIVFDPLAASGVRGIRILKEIPNVKKLVFNDLNPKACELIKRNLELNKIRKGFEILNKDANVVMLENRKAFDYVDIDPFGSPIRYLRNVGACLHSNSLLGVTATDSGALAGSFPKACLRRYGVRVVRTDFSKELGVRVLITSILRNLAPFDVTFNPLYSHANHYFRTIGRIDHGREKVDKNLSKIRMVFYCPSCLEKWVGFEMKCKNCGKKTVLLGPIWIGEIQDQGFCKKLLKEFVNYGFRDRKELEMSCEEIDQPFYYDIHKICKKAKINPPKIDRVIEKLKDKGFEVSRTHFCLTGIKTDADMSDLNKILIR